MVLGAVPQVASQKFELDGLYYYVNSDNSGVILTWQNAWDPYVNGNYPELSGDIIIPEYITYQGITYPVVAIGEAALCSCKGITSVMIPNTVTSIGNHAFDRCTGLSYVSIGDAVSRIDYNAFQDCTSLTGISIPNSVTMIGHMAFMGCTSLFSLTLSNSIESIDFKVFAGCTSLTSLTIPNSVKSIGYEAFSGCVGLKKVYSLIENPEDVSLGQNVFLDISNSCILHVPLGKVDIYSNAEQWKDFSIIVDDSAYSADIISFVDDEVKRICVENWDINNDGELSKYEASSVTDLGNVFSNNEQIQSFDELQYFTGLDSIGDLAFSCCYYLTSITIPNSVTSIGYGAFNWCCRLTSVIIPNSVTSLAFGAFYGCQGLLNVTIPNSVTSIGGNAFYWCERLTSLTIPESVTEIGERAFEACLSLKSVTWNAKNCNAYYSPISNRSIFGYDENSTSNVTTFIFGDEVQVIPDGLCYHLANLKEIYVSRQRPVVIPSDKVFFKVDKEMCTLYVPYGSEQLYWVSYGWNSFINIVEWGSPQDSFFGDVNGDGTVNIVDVTDLIDYLLNK